MKIYGLGPQDVYKSYNKGKVSDSSADNGKTAAAESGSDRVEISSQGSDISEARALAQKVYATGESQDERAERIDTIRAQIESGEYNISSEDVAKCILYGKTDDNNV